MAKEYTSTQISKYQTDTKLIETLSNLHVAPTNKFANLHANGDIISLLAQGERQVYSRIKLVLQDYSKGTGSSMVRSHFNLLPSDVEYLYSNVYRGVKDFSFNREKIFATENRDANVSKLSILRSETDKKGEKRRYAWFVKVENGIGVAVVTKTGGTYCEKGSYNCMRSVYINMNDEAFFKIMYETSKFIHVWELTSCPSLIRVGQDMYYKQRQD